MSSKRTSSASSSASISSTKSTSSNKVDPHAKREASNYKNPVPSREHVIAFLEEAKCPYTHPELCEHLSLTGDDDVEAMRRRLIAMARDGQLVCNRRGQYAPIKSIDLIKGRVIGHKDGYGFVVPEDGTQDLMLTARQMRSVYHGDKVLVRVDDVDQRGRRMAVVVDVLERNSKLMVGRLYKEHGISFVVPENTRIASDILIEKEGLNGATEGQYVSVDITRYPTVRTQAMGRIVEILGDHLAPGMEIEVAIRSHALPHEWTDEVLEQVNRIPDEVTEADIQGRVDLCHLPFVTIDGEDARDFDDAVYCEKKKSGGWRLYVAIADVANYVKRDTPLDTEALSRGNSVYFPGQVVPMLPEKLSNGLCSLNPEVKRLCMVSEMTISAQGRLSGYKFYEAVIYSHARLTYTKVGELVENQGSDLGQRLSVQYADLLPPIFQLYALYGALRIARSERGAIDFETVETQIQFDAERKIEEIVPAVRNVAHKIIEECMLCANVATARMLFKMKVPTLYRIHEGPGEEKLTNLRLFLSELGLDLSGGDKPTPKDYQLLLSEIKDRPDFSVIQTVMLRSLSQAVYSPELKGHFGLGYPQYAHFTSPIRRYPDLLVHRAIKSLIHKEEDLPVLMQPTIRHPEKNAYKYGVPEMLELGEHCSMTERRADEATRDVVNWLKCEFLEQHVGEEFDGLISAVTSFGFFVELKELYVDGLVHVSSLNGDYYHFDKPAHRLMGERTGQSYRIGDEVKIRVVRVNLEERKIDFELLGATPRRNANKKSGSRRGGKAFPSKSDDFKKGKKTTAKDGDKSKKSGKKKKKSTMPKGKKRKLKSREGVEKTELKRPSKRKDKK